MMLFLKIFSIRNFQGFVVYCLIIKVLCSCSQSSNFYILPHRFYSVKNFFILFFAVFRLSLASQLKHTNIYQFVCQDFQKTFYMFFHFSQQDLISYLTDVEITFVVRKTNGEGGIWTLAPLLTTYSLSRGAPSASLGTSPKRPVFNIHDTALFVQYFFCFFYFSSFLQVLP